jgi:hypothetical protein
VKAHKIFVYADFQADAAALLREHGALWTDQQTESGYAVWINPNRPHWFAGMDAPVVLHWHCQEVPLEHRELMKSRYAFLVPVHCVREGCHDPSQRSASG